MCLCRGLLSRARVAGMHCYAASDVECYTISKVDLLEFITAYPGTLVQLLDKYTLPKLDAANNPDHIKVSTNVVAARAEGDYSEVEDSKK